MTIMHKFEESFSERAIKRGGLTLFPAADALVLIEAARAHRAPVLGVETFQVTELGIRPQMDNILDLSGADSQCDTWEEARQFISERSIRGFLFEVVL